MTRPAHGAASIPAAGAALARASRPSDDGAIMRRGLQRAVLAVGATGLALLAGELLWRALRTSGYGPTTNPAYVPADAELGWRYRPLARARHRSDDFDVAVEINAQGFRDRPFEPGTGGPRIVALGDSLTFGWGVEAGQGFTSRLEELLGADVLDLGVCGYGTDQELLLWEREGRALRPAVVLILVCANDLEEIARPAAYGRPKPWFTLRDGALQLGGVPVPVDPLAECSHLARSLRAWSIKRSTPPLAPDERAGAEALQCALVARLASEVQAAGARLLVVSDGTDGAAPCLRSSSAWPFLDVRPALESAARSGAVTFASDAHWTAHGHQAVAEAIAARLQESGWLP